ncbi:MAG TPA: radical SAM protein [Dehalococcoidia bacterium]|nr:radical SAM protein [Dehalococcoidia bacterium]
MAPLTVHEITAKSVINRVVGMPFAWSINPYRGCRHACVYCYARPTHEYLGLNGAEEFQEVIFAKINAPEIVRLELRRRSWRHESVAIGTATDPYQPAEVRYKITRGIIEAFRDCRNPLTITTKSPFVLRDLDLLSDLAQHADVTIHMTVTTLDEKLWRELEPTTAKPWKRIKTLKALHQRGIRTGVFLSPILPGLTDDVPHMEAVVAACAEAGVDFAWGGTLRLGPGVKDYYEDFLQRKHPELTDRYLRLYPGSYAPASYQDRVQKQLSSLTEQYGMMQERVSERPPSQTVAQLPLFSAVA